ncbi:ABC transporter permease [Tessaracoccus sp. OH4464_COT-324]|uniref:ABC transporter permease n=1 Tax=Tessaracoccus sp. OH4464_COT-324 TaxID=2491059 RepID=UPI000F630C67|nr:FtsX-like permease family protein [Tessaracoccus sp. OH4464_COT-324]RRD47089.1 FtsX-like permease family protein [Tessaracoccus sp. OH4464_COT-324]
MRRFAFAQLRSSWSRYVAAGIAIILGTAFLAAALLTSDVFRATAYTTASSDLKGAGVLVGPADHERHKAYAEEAEKIGQIPGVRAVEPQGAADLRINRSGSNFFLTVSPLTDAGTRPKLDSGEYPSGPGQVALERNMAEALGAKPGDSVSARIFDYSPQNDSAPDEEGYTLKEHSIDFLVTGVYFEPKLVFTGTSAYATAAQTDLWAKLSSNEDEAEDLLVFLNDGANADEVAAEIGKVTRGLAEARTSDEVVADRVEELLDSSSFFTLFGLSFAAVAIIVAGMVIANTFEVLVAQRTKLLAQLRCSGATRGQIGGSVLLEAAVFGLLSAGLGTLGGIGFGLGASWVVSRLDLGFEAVGIADVAWPVFVVPVIVGAVVTVLAALRPALSATGVSPVEALRPSTVGLGRGGSKGRAVVGSLTLLLGAVLLLAPAVTVLVLASSNKDDLDMMVGLALTASVLGGLILVGGFLVSAVFLVPPTVRALGGFAARLLPKNRAATVRLATANAARNPRRTSATASAVVLGVGLVTMMATGAATAQATAAKSLDSLIPADVFVSSPDGPLTKSQLDALHKVEGVEAFAHAWFAQSTGHDLRILIADFDQLRTAVNPPITAPKPDHIRLLDGSLSNSLRTGKMEIRFSDGTLASYSTEIRPDSEFKSFLDKSSVPKDTDLGSPHLFVAKVQDVKTVRKIQEAVSKADGGAFAEIQAPIEQRAMLDQVINALLSILLGLLGVAVVIALVGVANTLSLSVIERRRELGTLRAVGVTRGQVRSLLTVEGVLISLTGAVIGIALGLLCGFAGTAVLLGMANYAFAVHWSVTLGAIGVALLAGFVASVFPARSALRVPVVAALATE